MAQDTAIQWCDASSNLTRYRDRETGRDLWACVKTSPGCAHCYSEAKGHWLDRGRPFTRPNMELVEPYFCEKEARSVLRSTKLSGERLFVDDMTDGFGDWVPFDLIDRRFAVFALRHDVTFQVLTKWPERMLEWIRFRDSLGGTHYRVHHEADRLCSLGRDWKHLALFSGPGPKGQPESAFLVPRIHYERMTLGYQGMAWPLPNVWLGCSIEDQKRADERRESMRQLAEAGWITWVSYEPALGDVDWSGWEFLRWMVIGGESGPKARPFDVQWARRCHSWCRRNGVAPFVKQLGSFIVDRNDAGFDGPDDCNDWPEPLDVRDNIHGFREEYQGADCRVVLRHKKGGDIEEWPIDLRVREFPERTESSCATK